MKRGIVQLAVLLLGVALCVSADASPGGKKGAKHAVSIEGMKFTPDKLDIDVGDTVEWTNNDVHDHTVTAKDGSFKSDNIGNGQTFSHTFKKAGKFAYSCSLHPRMKGQINVSGD